MFILCYVYFSATFHVMNKLKVTEDVKLFHFVLYLSAILYCRENESSI